MGTHRVIIVPAAFQQLAHSRAEATAEVTQARHIHHWFIPDGMNPHRTTSAAARLPNEFGDLLPLYTV